VKRTRAKSIFLTFGILLAAGIGPSVSTAFGRPRQNAPAQDAPAQQTLKTKTELVKLDVTVLDEQGNFVDGLKQDNFRVFDDGVERPILFFAPVSEATKVVVVLEASPAVYLFKEEHLAAAYSLLSGLAPDDDVALVSYSDVPRSVVPFTTNRTELLNALGNIQYMMGSAALNLYNTVSDLLDGLARFPGKKAIVLLTTGLDSSSPARWDALTQKLRGSDVVIYSIGLLGPLMASNTEQTKHTKKISGAAAFDTGDLGTTPALEKVDQALLSLSTMTGGQAYFPTSGQGFAPAYREIAACLRHEYVVGISPEHDGQFHTLTVNVDTSNAAVPAKEKKKHKKKHGKAEYRIAFRQGYTAPGS
jgi:Ca-activated chloride channel homolog